MWLPYTEDEKKTSSELASLLIEGREAFRAVVTSTERRAAAGSEAARDQEALTARTPALPDGGQHLVTQLLHHYLYFVLTRALDEEADVARSGNQERTKGASQQAQGRLKEAIGGLTGNRRQAKQGRADQARGRLRERWGHLKDALHR